MNIKKTITASLVTVLLASVGAGAANVNASSFSIVKPSQYRIIKHAHAIKGSEAPHASLRPFGDDSTVGYANGYRVVIGNDGSVKSINGHKPTKKSFRHVFSKKHYRHRAKKHVRRHVRRRFRAIVPAHYQHNYYGRAKDNHIEYRLRGNYAYFTDMSKSHNKHWIKYRLGRGSHGKILTFNSNYLSNPFKLVGNHIRMMYDTTPVNLYR